MTSEHHGPPRYTEKQAPSCLQYRWGSRAPRREPPAQGLLGRQSQDAQQLLCFPNPELKPWPLRCPVQTLTCTALHKGSQDQLVLLSFIRHPE